MYNRSAYRAGDTGKWQLISKKIQKEKGLQEADFTGVVERVTEKAVLIKVVELEGLSTWFPQSMLKTKATSHAVSDKPVTIYDKPYLSAGKMDEYGNYHELYVKGAGSQSQAFKNTPGRIRYDAIEDCWYFHASPSAAAAIFSLVEPYNPIVDDAFKGVLAAFDVQIMASKQRYDPDPPPIPITGIQKPWLHQTQAFWFVIKHFGGLPNEQHS